VSPLHGAEHKIWASVMFLIIFYFVDFHYHLTNINFWLAWLLVIFGAYFPDIDLDFGTRFHRNLFTHSHIVVMFIAAVYFTTPVPQVLELLGFFFLGYASHLLLDIFPSNASVFKRVWTIFASYQTPGDLRGIPEWLERPWLVICGIITASIGVLFLNEAWTLVPLNFFIFSLITLILGVIWAVFGILQTTKESKKKKHRRHKSKEEKE